jgi:hypothetical protein
MSGILVHDTVSQYLFQLHRYVRALGAYYLRLTGTSVDCYKYLEPLLNDYRHNFFYNLYIDKVGPVVCATNLTEKENGNKICENIDYERTICFFPSCDRAEGWGGGVMYRPEGWGRVCHCLADQNSNFLTCIGRLMFCSRHFQSKFEELSFELESFKKCVLTTKGTPLIPVEASLTHS